MRKIKSLLSVLFLIMVLVTVAVFASCDKGDDDSDGTTGTTDSTAGGTTSSTQGGTTDSSTGTTDSSTGASDVAKSTYTVLVVDKNTGKPIPNVNIYVQSEKDAYATAHARGKTDANGVFTANVEPSKAKYVCIENVPEGYAYDEFYDMGTTGVEIKIGTEIIKNHDGFEGGSLQLGSVMYDFTLTTLVYDKETGEVVPGKKITLSELFANGKKAVMLNFWYTTCTYCIEEFPYIQEVYEKYGDEIEIIGPNLCVCLSMKTV